MCSSRRNADGALRSCRRERLFGRDPRPGRTEASLLLSHLGSVSICYYCFAIAPASLPQSTSFQKLSDFARPVNPGMVGRLGASAKWLEALPGEDRPDGERSSRANGRSNRGQPLWFGSRLAFIQINTGSHVPELPGRYMVQARFLQAGGDKFQRIECPRGK